MMLAVHILVLPPKKFGAMTCLRAPTRSSRRCTKRMIRWDRYTISAVSSLLLGLLFIFYPTINISLQNLLFITGFFLISITVFIFLVLGLHRLVTSFPYRAST